MVLEYKRTKKKYSQEIWLQFIMDPILFARDCLFFKAISKRVRTPRKSNKKFLKHIYFKRYFWASLVAQ